MFVPSDRFRRCLLLCAAALATPAFAETVSGLKFTLENINRLIGWAWARRCHDGGPRPTL